MPGKPHDYRVGDFLTRDDDHFRRRNQYRRYGDHSRAERQRNFLCHQHVRFLKKAINQEPCYWYIDMAFYEGGREAHFALSADVC